jgi:hypothetical protein
MIPKLDKKLLYPFMSAADVDAIAEDEVGGDVNDRFGHWISTSGLQGVTIQLLDFGDVAVVGLAEQSGPAFLFISNFGADSGQAGSDGLEEISSN